jgi:hypothetical protein
MEGAHWARLSGDDHVTIEIQGPANAASNIVEDLEGYLLSFTCSKSGTYTYTVKVLSPRSTATCRLEYQRLLCR